MVETLVVAALLGLLPAAIAQKKGQNFVAWWLYGFLLFIVALPHALMMGSSAKGEHRSFRMTPSKSPVPPRDGRADPAERIERLKDLADKGLISSAEFDTRRSEVLSDV